MIRNWARVYTSVPGKSTGNRSVGSFFAAHVLVLPLLIVAFISSGLVFIHLWVGGYATQLAFLWIRRVGASHGSTLSAAVCSQFAICGCILHVISSAVLGFGVQSVGV